jgi:hypothetical protein
MELIGQGWPKRGSRALLVWLVQFVHEADLERRFEKILYKKETDN